MKKIPLYNFHVNQGAKMIDYYGFQMPIQYLGATKEHINVRQHVGMFDVSHMGEFIVEGPEALDFLQYVTSNDVSKLNLGKVQYSCFPDPEHGGIVDDLLIYQLEKQKYMLVVNAGNIDKNLTHLEAHNIFDCKLSNVSEDICILAVQGPKSKEMLQNITTISLSDISYYHFAIGHISDCQDIIFSNTGYTGAGGFELYVNKNQVETVAREIMKIGEQYNLMLSGLAARDTLRLEMGFCLYGNDIDETTTPIEAGLSWITSFNKEFINKDKLLEQRQKGLYKRLIGFELLEKGIARKDYKVLDKEGNEIGVVTSGTMSPSLNKAIGMAYVTNPNARLETEFCIAIRNKKILAKVVKRPFL